MDADSEVDFFDDVLIPVAVRIVLQRIKVIIIAISCPEEVCSPDSAGLASFRCGEGPLRHLDWAVVAGLDLDLLGGRNDLGKQGVVPNEWFRAVLAEV